MALYYLLTYLLTPWCRVLLEKLTGLQLVKKFPAFYGTRRFITVLTSVRHLSLSWANPIQSTYPHPTFWRSILILSTHLRLGLPSGLFPSGFPTKTLWRCIAVPNFYTAWIKNTTTFDSNVYFIWLFNCKFFASWSPLAPLPTPPPPLPFQQLRIYASVDDRTSLQGNAKIPALGTRRLPVSESLWFTYI